MSDLPASDERLEQIHQVFTEAIAPPTTARYDPTCGSDYTPVRHEQRRRWDRLCTLIDGWVEHAIPLSAEIDEAMRRLATFSDDVRIAPDHWFLEVAYTEWTDVWAAWDVRVGSVTRMLTALHPAWQLVRMIVLEHELPNAAIQEAFCSYPGMASIRGLVVIREPDHLMLNEGFFHILTESPALTSLRLLRAAGHSLNDRVLHDLAGWPGAEHLTTLDLSEGIFSARAVQELVTSPHLRALETLQLNGATIPLPS